MASAPTYLSTLFILQFILLVTTTWSFNVDNSHTQYTRLHHPTISPSYLGNGDHFGYLISYKIDSHADVISSLAINLFWAAPLLPSVDPYTFTINTKTEFNCTALQPFTRENGDNSITTLFPLNHITMTAGGSFGNDMYCYSSETDFEGPITGPPVGYIIRASPTQDQYCGLKLFIQRTVTKQITCIGFTPNIIGQHFPDFESDPKLPLDIPIKQLNPLVGYAPLGAMALELDYEVGSDLAMLNPPQNQDRDPTAFPFPPRIDYLKISLSNLPDNSIIDFALAFDHSTQKRIDRVFYLDEPVLQAISRYWANSNDPSTPSVSCEHGFNFVRIAFRTPTPKFTDEDGGAFQSLSIVTNGLSENSLCTAKSPCTCTIPIPIHLIHARVIQVPYLDVGEWHNEPFSIYLQLQRENRFFRHLPAHPNAKWNFFHPILASHPHHSQQHYIDPSTNIIHFHHTTILSGPYPHVFLDEWFPNSPFSTFIQQILASDSTSFYYITNPTQYRTPQTIQRTNLLTRAPLSFSNYNGFLNITLQYQIKATSELIPFYLKWSINSQPHYYQFFPRLDFKHEIEAVTDTSIMIQSTIKFAQKFELPTPSGALQQFAVPEEVLQDDLVLPVDLALPLPRFAPFELIQYGQHHAPQCYGVYLNHKGEEVPPYARFTLQIKENELVARVYSQKGISIEVIDLKLPFSLRFAIRCQYVVVDSPNKPFPPGSTRLGVDAFSIYKLYEPMLYSNIHPPVGPNPVNWYQYDLSQGSTPRFTSNTDIEEANGLKNEEIQQASEELQLWGPQQDTPTWRHGSSGVVSYFAIYSLAQITTTDSMKALLDRITEIVNTAVWYTSPTTTHTSLLSDVQVNDWRFASNQLVRNVQPSLFRSANYPGSSMRARANTEFPFSIGQNTRNLAYKADTTTLLVALEAPFESKSPDIPAWRLNLTQHAFAYNPEDGTGDWCIVHYIDTITHNTLLLAPIYENIDTFLPHDEEAEVVEEVEAEPTTTTTTTTTTTAQTKSHQTKPVDAPLPAGAICTTDSNCMLSMNCIQGRCQKEKWGLNILSIAEIHLQFLFEAANSSPGLPSLYCAPPRIVIPESHSGSWKKRFLILSLVTAACLTALALIWFFCQPLAKFQQWRQRKRSNVDYFEDGDSDEEDAE